MFLENVYTSLLLGTGTSFDYVLFKIAIHFAENGLRVWFISQQVIDEVPSNIGQPDKEILQLITFVYLKDHKSLINHLNAIHLWKKPPSILIITGFEVYTNLRGDTYNAQLAALISTTLLLSASVSAKRNQMPVYLILTAEDILGISRDRLQVLCDMYFPHIVNKRDNSVFEEIIQYFSK